MRRGPDKADELGQGDPCCEAGTCADGITCPVRSTWLLRNTGAGAFEDVTVSSGLIQNRTVTDPDLGRPGSVYAFGDVDNDGDLDAYVGKASDTDPISPETSELMLNQGDGTFALGAAESGLRWVSGDAPSGASFVDFDLNGVLDLWITQNTVGGQARQDRLYYGDGAGLFSDATDAAGLTTVNWFDIADLNAGRGHSVGWGALACDLNGDGLSELLASSYGRSPNHLWQAGGSPLAVTYGARHRVGLRLRRPHGLDGQRIGAVLVSAPPHRRGLRRGPRPDVHRVQHRRRRVSVEPRERPRALPPRRQQRGDHVR